MSAIGVRELKIHASEIMRRVKENRERYVVTHRGQPVAVIIPVDEAQPGPKDGASAWEELVALGQQIGRGWQSPQTSAEILSEMRR
jgi:prevent-host-death family protein